MVYIVGRMRIFTSRYQNKALAGLPVVPVGISAGAPRFKTAFPVVRLPALAPARSMFALDREGFIAAYRAMLDGLGVERVLAMIAQATGGRDACLLCFCDVVNGADCHRRVLADWLHDRTGELVLEIELPFTWETDDETGVRSFSVCGVDFTVGIEKILALQSSFSPSDFAELVEGWSEFSQS